MHKFSRNIFALVLAATTLSSCKPQTIGRKWFVYREEHMDEFGDKMGVWSAFGNLYGTKLGTIVDEAKTALNSRVGAHQFQVKYEAKNSYNDIKKAVSSAISDSSYPNILQGYPDHFASYLQNDILRPLDTYFDNYKITTGIDLKEDYYEAYMTENTNLDIDENGNKVITGIPFNKSTELLGYNGVFVDYCKKWCEDNPNVEVKGVKASNWKLDEIPATWQGADGWETKGFYYKHIMDTLSRHETKSGVEKYGCLVYGKQAEDGTASDFEVVQLDATTEKADPAETKGDRKLLMNFKEVERDNTRVLGWDATDNMFITLLRQWGAQYTELPETELTKLPKKRVGKVLFNSSVNKPIVIDMLRYFCQMNLDGIIGTALQFDDTYCTNAYYKNNVMFMVCSSGGFAHSTKSWESRLRVAPLPYYKKDGVIRKYVISQGANIAISRLWGGDDAFDLAVALTTGEFQAKWCTQTGYFPASRSARNHPLYKEMLESTDYSNAELVAYREGSQLNSDYYMPVEKVQELTDTDFNSTIVNNKSTKYYVKDSQATTGYSPATSYSEEGEYYDIDDINRNHFKDENVEWTKFVDAAFGSSSIVRQNVASVFSNLFEIINASNISSDTKFNEQLKLATTSQSLSQKTDVKIVK